MGESKRKLLMVAGGNPACAAQMLIVEATRNIQDIQAHISPRVTCKGPKMASSRNASGAQWKQERRGRK